MLKIQFNLNGEDVGVEIKEGTRAIDLLRNKFGLTGTKESCGQGECGSCTVLVNSEAVHSCLMLAAQLDGTEVITIEGLEKNGELDILQKAFLEAGAIQCGYCTPGMIMAAKGLLLHNPAPDLEEIKEAMSGNLCRCTGYKKIIEAVEIASMNQGGEIYAAAHR